MAHYLVTGGAGFIGSHLTERLLRDGHQVRILDDFSTGRESNIDAVRPAGADRLDVMRGDLANPDTVAQAAAGVDGVFHLGALGSVPRSVDDPLASHAANATGTVNVLTACRDLKVKRVLFASSSSVYGDLDVLPKREDHPVNPLSPYALTKLMGEEYLRIFRELYGMETVALRFYNVFGPRQNPAGPYAAVIPIFLKKITAGEHPVVDGDGEQSRDFTYVENVVDANVRVMAAPWEAVNQGLFNVAAGGRYSLNHLLGLFQDMLGMNITAEHGPDRPGDVKHSQADVTRLEEAIGFKATVSFEEGLRRTVDYYRAHETA